VMGAQNNEVRIPSGRGFQDFFRGWTELNETFGPRRKTFIRRDYGMEPFEPFLSDSLLVLCAGTIGHHMQERKR